MNAGSLLAAIGYLLDITPAGSYYHSWRVALISRHLAKQIDPKIGSDVFYAGLLHDVGTVGAYKHITQYSSIHEQVNDSNIKNHPQRGATLLKWLPGMGNAAEYVKYHHEWWDGRGYPDHLIGLNVPLGARIISIVSAADISGCFKTGSSIRECLPLLSTLTGSAWGRGIWATLVRSTQDAQFYNSVTDEDALPSMIAEALAELPVPRELDNKQGVDKILHIISTLVDLKDPSTAGHSYRVACMAKNLAEYMKLPQETVELAYRAGLVHDSGRLGIDSYILSRTGRLKNSEMRLVREHAKMTIRVFDCIPGHSQLSTLGYVAGHDHERFDGRGYPDRLSGEDIPLVARILSVVDAYDSMISTANFRVLTPRGAVVRIEENSGTQFAPDVVKAFVSAIRECVFNQDCLAA